MVQGLTQHWLDYWSWQGSGSELELDHSSEQELAAAVVVVAVGVEQTVVGKQPTVVEVAGHLAEELDHIGMAGLGWRLVDRIGRLEPVAFD